MSTLPVAPLSSVPRLRALESIKVLFKSKKKDDGKKETDKEKSKRIDDKVRDRSRNIGGRGGF